MTQPDDPYASSAVGDTTLELLESATRYNRWLVSKILPFLGQRNLELGAGRGTLTAMIATDREVAVVEPSCAGRTALHERFVANCNVIAIAANLSDLDANEGFDAVYCANVLEHIPDDLGTIREACALLRSGGHFVAVVPAGTWLYSRFDASVGHYRRYGRSDRIRLSEGLASGHVPLVLKSYRAFNPVGALGWFFRMRLLGRTTIAPDDARLFNRLVPLLSRLDSLHLPLGQSLLMVFMRTS